MALYFINFLVLSLFYVSCDSASEENPDPGEERSRAVIKTEKTAHDTDDPAIWLNREDPAGSIVFGTDKDTDGAIYAFNLQGEIMEDKTLRGFKRPNNVDIRYSFSLGNSETVDLMAFTERERGQVRIFSVPGMQPLDGGGFPVFTEAEESDHRLPMGISFYDPPGQESLYLIVSRKDGPQEGYLHQYKIIPSGEGVSLELVRKFGKFSGNKEIEAIAVDDQLGFVYYSDETFGIRKYHADPAMGNEEIANFGGETFERDNEGIAILPCEHGQGYIIVSNQQAGSFNLFSRTDNSFIKEIDLGTSETDGIELLNHPLGNSFPNGLFVAMNNDRDFYFFDLERLEACGL